MLLLPPPMFVYQLGTTTDNTYLLWYLHNCRLIGLLHLAHQFKLRDLSPALKELPGTEVLFAPSKLENWSGHILYASRSYT